LLAALQGGSYLGFGLWSLLGRKHYVRLHRLERDGWLLNAHGVWLVVVGTALAIAGYRREVQTPLRALGVGAAMGLAADDAISAARRGVAPIYHADLAWEVALAAGWAVALGRRA
jgi:hypothetical protein